MNEHERFEPAQSGIVPTAVDGHTPPHGPTGDLPELPEAVEYLLDALELDDLGELVEKLHSRAAVADAILVSARAVIARLAGADEPVQNDELVRLAGAMISKTSGVQRNVTNAVRRFQRFRAHPDIPPEILARIGFRHEDLLPLVDATIRVDRRLRAAWPETDTLFATPVITTVLRAGRSPEEAAGVVPSVLLAADRHVHAHLNAGRPMPGANELVGGVIGNADFLLQVAALRTALDEHLHPDAAADPGGAVEDHLKQLTSLVERAMRRPPWRARSSHDSGEPDAVNAFERIAAYLGAAADAASSADGAARAGSDRGGPSGSGRSADSAAAVRRVYAELTPWVRRLRMRPPPARQVALDDRDTGTTGAGPTVENEMADLDHRLTWLIAALFRRVDTADHPVLLGWLHGSRPVDSQDDMWLLVECVRTVAHTMKRVPAEPAPVPVGLPNHTYRRLVDHLSRTVAPGGVAEPLAAAVLPPLWSRRHLVIGLVVSHLATIHFGDDARGLSQALAFTAAVVGGPVQYFSRNTATPAHGCRRRLDDGSGCDHWDGDSRVGEPDPAEICRDRLWHEPGLVDSYQTAFVAARARSAESVRRQLARYSGPGAWMVHPRTVHDGRSRPEQECQEE